MCWPLSLLMVFPAATFCEPALLLQRRRDPPAVVPVLQPSVRGGCAVTLRALLPAGGRDPGSPLLSRRPLAFPVRQLTGFLRRQKPQSRLDAPGPHGSPVAVTPLWDVPAAVRSVLTPWRELGRSPQVTAHVATAPSPSLVCPRRAVLRVGPSVVGEWQAQLTSLDARSSLLGRVGGGAPDMGSRTRTRWSRTHRLPPQL